MESVLLGGPATVSAEDVADVAGMGSTQVMLVCDTHALPECWQQVRAWRGRSGEFYRSTHSHVAGGVAYTVFDLVEPPVEITQAEPPLLLPGIGDEDRPLRPGEFLIEPATMLELINLQAVLADAVSRGDEQAMRETKAQMDALTSKIEVAE